MKNGFIGRIHGFRRLASGLVAMLAISALIIGVMEPCPSMAGVTPSLNVKTKVMSLSAGNDTYQLKVVNKPAKYSCTWNSGDESVVTTEWVQYGKCNLQAVGAGTTTVTCEFIDKVSQTRYILTSKITVEDKNAVTAKHVAAITLAVSTNDPLGVGDTMKLTPALYYEDGSLAKDTTDLVRWVSSDEKILGVDKNGMVTAKGVGSADITCYTVASDKAADDLLSAATAKKSVTVMVKDVMAVGISSIMQKTVNSFDMVFASDVSGILKKEDISVSQNGVSEVVSDLSFSKDGKTATVTTYGDLGDKVPYDVEVASAGLKDVLKGAFTSSKGDPVRMELYTEVSGNRVVVNEYTTIGFRLYNAKGVDITPVDPTSSEYMAYANNIRIKAQNTGVNGVYCNDRSLFSWTEGLTFTITGEYKTLVYENNAYSEKLFCSASITVKTVTEAETINFVDAMVTDSELTGASLDWTKKEDTLSVSDEAGYRITARATDYKGNYIYSDTANSPLSFEFETSTAAFVGSDGTVTPIAVGKDLILVKYNVTGVDGSVKSTTIGTFTVNVSEARKPVKLAFMQNGEEVSFAGASNRTGVSETEFDAYLYDQFGKVIRMQESDITIVPTDVNNGTVSPAPMITINNDGSVKVKFDALWYDFGADGSVIPHYYEFKYDNAVYGQIGSIFALYVMNPNESLPSTYQVEVYGNKDIMVSSQSDSLPVLDVRLYEMKGSVKNRLISLIYPGTYDGTVFADADTYFYKLYLLEDGKQTEITTGTEISLIKPVCLSDSGTQLIKYKTGVYKLDVYKKVITNQGNTAEVTVASTNFILTDNQSRVTVKQLSASTLRPLSINSTEEELKTVLLECFDIKIGSGTVGTTQISLVNPIKTSKAIFYRDITITESLNIGGVTYALVHTVTINQAVKQK